jgi:hypothetical protein
MTERTEKRLQEAYSALLFFALGVFFASLWLVKG